MDSNQGLGATSGSFARSRPSMRCFSSSVITASIRQQSLQLRQSQFCIRGKLRTGSPLTLSPRGELLDAVVIRVHDIQILLMIHSHPVRRHELPGLDTRLLHQAPQELTLQ